MENAYIYGLSDPRDGRIRYIGRTRQSFARRLTGHCCSKFLRGNSRREQWITSLTSSGQKPFIQFLECVPGNGFDAERKWIAKYREMGHDLTNSTDGGAAPGPLTVIVDAFAATCAVDDVTTGVTSAT